MIERLYVHNFRCLENFTLDFGGNRSSLLIGKNGAGKSTVLAALGVFQSICRGPNRVKDIIKARDFAKFDKSLPMRFELEASISNSRFKYAVSFDWPADFYEARVTEESLHKDGIPVFTREESQVTLPAGGTFRLDWHVFALPVINEKPSERSIRDVKAFFETMMILEPIPKSIMGFSEEPQTDLAIDANNYAACLRSLLQSKPKAYGVFEKFVKNVMPDFSSIENVDRGKEGGAQLVVSFEQDHPHQTAKFDFDVLSAGEKCFLLAAYVIAANSVRSTDDSPVVCVWDEPDNHLSVSQVGHFITDMRKMVNRGGQFIATTHHPETIRKFSDDNTYVLTRRSHFEPTVVKLLNTFNVTGDLIHALIRDEIIG